MAAFPVDQNPNGRPIWACRSELAERVEQQVRFVETQNVIQIAEVQIAEVQIAEVQIAEVQIAEVQIAEVQIAEVQIAEVQISPKESAAVQKT